MAPRMMWRHVAGIVAYALWIVVACILVSGCAGVARYQQALGKDEASWCVWERSIWVNITYVRVGRGQAARFGADCSTIILPPASQ